MEQRRYRNNLKLFRRERGLTQTKAASIMGLQSSSLLSRWEKGIVMPEIRNALKMAALYRTSVDVIYHDLRLSITDEISTREKAAVIAGEEEYE